jgi:hypothetical protein
MLTLVSPPAIAGVFAFLTLAGAAPALALSPVTFVSGKGTDSGTCASPATPCRTFQFAFGQTNPGGEIKARDPADYGRVTITKSVSITGVEGAGIFQTANANAITINAGPNDTINLSHLTLDGFKTAFNGIQLNSGGSLTVTHCKVRNFTNGGMSLLPIGLTKFLIRDTMVLNNSGTGIAVSPQGAGSTQGTLDQVSANNNGSGGISVTGFATSGVPIDVSAGDSVATNNGFGFGIGPKGALRLAHSAATGNGTGVFVNVGGTAESAGDNFINGNAQDFSGTLTKFGTK